MSEVQKIALTVYIMLICLFGIINIVQLYSAYKDYINKDKNYSKRNLFQWHIYGDGRGLLFIVFIMLCSGYFIYHFYNFIFNLL